MTAFIPESRFFASSCYDQVQRSAIRSLVDLNGVNAQVQVRLMQAAENDAEARTMLREQMTSRDEIASIEFTFERLSTNVELTQVRWRAHASMALASRNRIRFTRGW